MAANQSPFPTPAQKRPLFPRKSLPQAGESLQAVASDLIFDKSMTYAFVAIAFAVVAAVELVMRWLNRPLSPWNWAFAAVAMAALATWRWFKIKPQLAALKQGIRGERAMARMLEEMRVLGYVPFHDIPGEGYNVDHALIGPGGVFAIETKAISKRAGPNVQVDYDGKRVLVDGQTPDRDPVAQAQMSAKFLRDLLQSMTDCQVAVRPVVLFPRWYISRQPPGADVWVLNETAFAAFLKNERVKLSADDIALFVDRLERHLSSE